MRGPPTWMPATAERCFDATFAMCGGVRVQEIIIFIILKPKESKAWIPRAESTVPATYQTTFHSIVPAPL